MTSVRKLYATLKGAVQQPTMAGQLRRQVLFFVPVPIPVFLLVALIVGGDWSAKGWTILLAVSVGVASLLLAFVVQPTPLPEGLSAEASVRRSLYRFQQVTWLRIGLALTPIMVGAGAALAGGGLFPLAVAAALAWPQLLLALPGFFVISRARRSMEAWGTKAYLWAGLAQPARVEWPVITPILKAYRTRRRRLAAERQEAQAGGDDGADRLDGGESDRAEAADPRPETEIAAPKRAEGLIPFSTVVQRSARPVLRPRGSSRPKPTRSTRPAQRSKAKS
ncbi:hypothetical protein GCM10027294_36440 [Marinactinospora endophytica]